MKPLSIRGKFALWAAALAGVVLVVFAIGTFVNLYEEQLESVDFEISVHQKEIQGLSPATLSAKSPAELVGLEPWLALAVFDESGRVTQRSPALAEEFARAALNVTAMDTARDAAGTTWRLTAFPAGGATVVLGYHLGEVRENVQDLLVAYGFSIPVVLVVAALGGWWVAGRALAPLRTLTAAAESIRAGNLDRRVPEAENGDEIQRLATVLNAMLSRLELSFNQAQRFAADASHELRTPLTIIHGEIARLLRTPNLERTHEEKLLSLQEEIGRLDRITEHLLLLARFDSGQAALARERVDFSALVRAACEDAELLADALKLTVTTAILPDVAVTGDSAHLRRVVLTLLDNATRYNHPQGVVHCELRVHAGEVKLRVRNSGPGIPEEARAQVFQRFFRVDSARARGGHGLGLSLSSEIVLAHGGRIELAPQTDDGGTEFVVTLPRA